VLLLLVLLLSWDWKRLLPAAALTAAPWMPPEHF
jgi:hypothetical protein